MKYMIEVTRLGGDKKFLSADDRQYAAEIAAKSLLLVMSTVDGLLMGDHSTDPESDKMFFELLNQEQQVVMRLDAYPAQVH